MELGFLLTISCVMTTIAMVMFIGIILFILRFGTQGVTSLFNRFTGGGDDNAQTPATGDQGAQQPVVASSQSLRSRAQSLDFPAPATGAVGGFAAQSAGTVPDFPPMQNTQFGQSQQASLTPRGQSLGFNPQNQLGQTNSFQPSTPSLSPSRPFQAGTQPLNPQGQQFGGNQGLGGQQNFGQQQQGGFNAQGLGGQQNFGQQQGGLGQQPLRPSNQGLGNQQNFGQQQQGGFGGQQQQQNYGQQQGGLGGQQNFGQQQQGGFNAQGLGGQQQQGGFGGQQQQQNYGQQPPPPQQGGLGQNRPPLRSVPRPGNTQYDAPIGGRDRRQGDDRDYIYDDRSRGGNFVDDVGDFIDNF